VCHSLPVVSGVEELKELEKRLKGVREQGWDKMTRHCYEPGDAPDRGGARDAALAFSLVRGTLNLSSNQISQKVHTDVLFIVSHAKSFGPRLRTHV